MERRTRIDFVIVKQVKEDSGLYVLPNRGQVTSPQNAADIVNAVYDLSHDANERFGIIALDTKNKLNGLHIVSEGSLNASIVHPREVYKRAILNNAASIVAFHNHPSGDPTPSPEDIMLTNRLKESGDLLGIELLDHIIIGDMIFTSMKEQGLVV